MKNTEQKIKSEFGRAVYEYRHSYTPKMSQKMLAIKIARDTNGKNIKQEVISHLEHGKDVFLTKEEIVGLQKICVIPENIAESYIKLVELKYSSKIKENLVNIREHEYLLTKYKHSEVKFYEGDYHCYFHSTDSDDHKIVEGIMNISPFQTPNICEAKFVIYENGEAIKKYAGQFFLNTLYDMTYCILICEEKQETSFLISNHFNASKGKHNLFNLALVLTTSAGSQKLPTMHRMIISRKKLSQDTLEVLHSQLRLNTDAIYISETKLKEMELYYKEKACSSTDKKYKQVCKYILKTIEFIRNSNTKETYYSIEEPTIYNTKEVIPIQENKYIQSMVISEFRKNTDVEFNNKINERVADICLNIINAQTIE